MENFTFLKNDYPDLYLLCSDVAKYIDADNSISMLKARQAIEFIVKYLGAETDDLFVNINNLEDKNIANSRIIDLFHLIRKKANKSVHNDINSDTEGVLDALIEICVWLAVGYDKKNISIIKFTDKEKFFLKKYGDYKVSSSEEGFEAVDTVNPLEVVGKFSTEEYETADVLEQDVFETLDEYHSRIESLPAMKIGYIFMDESQIDKYTGISFPLFHINKNAKIESSPIVALYVLKKDVSNLDGILKAKLCIYNNKIYYNYDSLTMEDDNGNGIKLDAISWNKYGYEDEETFIQRIRKLPLLPVGIARPIRKEYSLSNQILPFEVKPMAYVTKLFNKNIIDCHLNRDSAKEICSFKSNFIVYSNFDDNLEPFNIRFCNKYSDWMVVFDTKGVVSKINRKEFEFLEVLKAADRGVIDAQYKLARLYECGYGVEENLPKALEWFRKAAEQGCVQAQYDMALCYATGYGVEENEQKAFEWYKKAAEQGYARSQHNLAECYANGYGVEENEQKAFEWYKKAAEQGYTPAYQSLSNYYRFAIGTEKDEKKADYWLEKKAKENKNRTKDDYNIEWYKKVAAKGYRNAQYHLALWYVNEDSLGNESEAFELFRNAANQGLINAQLQLADCYECGYGITANEQKAFEWYKKAAEQGDCNAQLNLARFFARGLGTEKNEQKAFEWFTKSAANGHAQAQYDLAVCYKNGNGVEKNEQKAFEWFKKSAENGYIDAQYELAYCYEKGRGSESDDQKAIEWYTKVAEQGNNEAKLRAEQLQKKIKRLQNGILLKDEHQNYTAEQLYYSGWYYENGVSVNQDKEYAKLLYAAAAQDGNSLAEAQLHYLNSLAELKSDHKESNTEASRLNNMGVDYLTGQNGMPKNIELALYCFRRAVELGSKTAEGNLLKLTEEASRYNAVGVEYWIQKRKELALYCFRRAVELGSKTAEDNLRKAAGLGKLNEMQDRSTNLILIEKYRHKIVEFVKDYDREIFPKSSYIRLDVLPEDKKRLSKNNFDSWNEIKDVENICLIEARGAFSYQAKPLNLYDENENEKNYYLVAPNKLTPYFTRKTVVEDAYLAFFRFTNKSVSERGARGRLVIPAIFQKVNGFYKLISKGEIELL